MKIIRSNQIIVALASGKSDRDKLLERVVVACGFAKIRSDAAKIINESILDIDIDNEFFIIAKEYNFQSSTLLTEKIIRLALYGIPVIISTRSIPNEYLQFCRVVQQRQ